MNEEFRNAAIFGDFEKVTRFIKEDSSILSLKDKYGFTVLHDVVGEHYFKMVKLLIESGADVNAQNEDGISPLHLAAYGETVNILIKNGSKIELENTRGETPLYIAASEQDGIDVIAALLDNGANPMHKNTDGVTPIDAARLRGEDDKVKLMNKYIRD